MIYPPTARKLDFSRRSGERSGKVMMSWSNAQAEGQISRLKMLKRTMYGRASFALLRRRILITA
ncbi:hypothetical protein MHZ93_04680 [Roseomonas sp. ACRSG]|nr:hypothetical protein [Roseomonas sp. ACRSG]